MCVSCYSILMRNVVFSSLFLGCASYKAIFLRETLKHQKMLEGSVFCNKHWIFLSSESKLHVKLGKIPYNSIGHFVT